MGSISRADSITRQSRTRDDATRAIILDYLPKKLSALWTRRKMSCVVSWERNAISSAVCPSILPFLIYDIDLALLFTCGDCCQRLNFMRCFRQLVWCIRDISRNICGITIRVELRNFGNRGGWHSKLSTENLSERLADVGKQAVSLLCI